MAMFRAMSVRRNYDRTKYEAVGEDSGSDLLDGELKRSTSLPARVLFGLYKSRKSAPEPPLPHHHHKNIKIPAPKPASRKGAYKIQHPLFGLFDCRRKEKTTAKPEFNRYLEYVKEGGIWDPKSNMPVIYYK